MELIKSKTFENLKKAFVAECCARTRYEFVEYGERFNGFEGLAKIVDEIAYQEFNHARMLYTEIQKVSKTTIDNQDVCVGIPFRQKWDMLENLKFVSEDERDEVDFYKKASKIANEEGFLDIANLFDMIKEVELKHSKIFKYLYEQLSNSKLYDGEKVKKFICPSCGYEMKGDKLPDQCPLCKAKVKTFELKLPKDLAL